MTFYTFEHFFDCIDPYFDNNYASNPFTMKSNYCLSIDKQCIDILEFLTRNMARLCKFIMWRGGDAYASDYDQPDPQQVRKKFYTQTQEKHNTEKKKICSKPGKCAAPRKRRQQINEEITTTNKIKKINKNFFLSCFV